MAETISYGLKTLEFGECTGEHSMPTAMESKFRTYRNSCEFTEDDPSVKDEYSDQDDDPFFSIVTKGKKSIKVSTFDYGNETLQFLKGGTVVDGQWHEPAGAPIIFKAVKIVTNTGLPFEFPKVQIVAKFNAKLTKEGVKLLEVTMTPMATSPESGTVIIGTKV